MKKNKIGEFKVFSKTHPDYKIDLIRLSDLSLTINTAYIGKVFKNITFKNHDSIDNVLSKLYSLNEPHPFKDWLKVFLPVAKLVPDDSEIPDKTYWSKNHYIPLSKNEKKENGVVQIKGRSGFNQSFIVTDAETTGLNSNLDSIIQLSAVKYKDGKIVDTFDRFIKPSNKKMISTFTTDLTGIRQEDVDQAQEFKEVWEDYLKFVDSFSGLIVGQNLIFDIKMMKGECARHKIDFPSSIRYQDTLTLAKELYPNLGSGQYKLELMKKRFLPNTVSELSSHNALNDCKITGELYLKFQELN